MGLVLLGVGTVGTAIVASAPIAAEKEAGTLAVLLTTPLGRREIILAKAVGVFRRSLPLWIPLLLHTAVGVASGFLPWTALPLVLLTALGMLVFLTGAGLLSSVRSRRAATAGVVTGVGCIVLFILVPSGVLAWAAFSLLGAGVAGFFRTAHPAVQVLLLTDPAVAVRGGEVYVGWQGLWVLAWVGGTAVFLAMLGMMLAGLAGLRLKKAV
jgi:ABC-type transport system involved in multi-copper enzyme maturation permease subunit